MMDPTSVEDSGLFEESFQNMKVVELKKELKARGLPTSGTKTELLERLQLAEASKESQISIEVTNEDEILNDTLEQSEAVPSTIPDVKPLKKRAITATNNVAVTEKKVSLNRANMIAVPAPLTTLATEAKETSQTAVTKKNVLAVKCMTPQERLAMRAQRFNVPTSTSSIKLKAINNNSFTASKYKLVKTGTKVPDLEVLKKRAERFGENVSSVMKQIEAKEKVLKRKLRFGGSSTVLSTMHIENSDELEVKRRRAQRFAKL